VSTQTKRYYSPAEYLELERAAEFKSEYFDGEIFAMSGASRAHGLIAANILASLHGQLRGKPCELFVADMRVKVDATGLYTYPDLVVACGDIRFEDKSLDTLLNPLVVIEVLSPSTEAYDRGTKFEHYRRLESLQEYVLVAQDRYHVDVFRRGEGGDWILSEARGLEETIRLPAIECQLELREVYDKVELPAEPRFPGRPKTKEN
jgi:Uma2 family endonuclease